MSEKPSNFPVTQPDGSPLKPITQVLLDRRAALLAVGLAEQTVKAYPGRFPIEQIVFTERYGDAWRRGR